MKKKPKLDPFWMALVLDKAAESLTVAAFDLSKETAERHARERVSPDAPVLCVNIVGGAGAMINQISLWLAEHDIVGAENTEIVREIAKGLKEVMAESLRDRKSHKSPPQ
jgi:hypothetical protein